MATTQRTEITTPNGSLWISVMAQPNGFGFRSRIHDHPKTRNYLATTGLHQHAEEAIAEATATIKRYYPTATKETTP